MKKMNLKFFGLRAKMVLPLFLLVGLFLISASSVSAQYVPKDEALVLIKQHIDQLDHTVLPMTKNQMASPEVAERNMDLFRNVWGEYMIYKMTDGGELSVAEAIEAAEALAEERTMPEEGIEIIKQEYIDLLTQ